MDVEKNLKEILYCKQLMRDMFSLSIEGIKYIGKGTVYMYFAVVSEHEPNLFYRIDKDLDTFRFEKGSWVYAITL
ncbi:MULTISPECIES: hypothetical protein [Bacillus]|uniref:hypothetical protein n=1 Tax=Bacillus TaxID=1386 RepID=UPI00077A3038|nr:MULTISPECIES: hypothetical protein [Bacillus cereus group]KAA0759147.1 hypothetical protein DN404_29080 [Bacillus sp. TE8-1]KXY55653.1 hypothetical protein AT278_17355 [Bacillus cereus]PED31719.1 hypothetical protein CON13_12800 [Bacillus cereus]PEE51314.1 hypothetical protein COM80_20495 [Bacillus cereus]PFI76255.1 hypothetical protein COI83_29495 [Bacillus cereus]